MADVRVIYPVWDDGTKLLRIINVLEGDTLYTPMNCSRITKTEWESLVQATVDAEHPDGNEQEVFDDLGVNLVQDLR